MKPRSLAVAIALCLCGAAAVHAQNSNNNQIVNYVLVERGYASWYGQEFDGRKTSNGEIFDSNKFTAAHKTLPFNTKVRVTNLATGRNVIVRINDRGPFVEGRSIDLSRAAAESIGIIGSGVASVSIEIETPVASPSPSPSAAAVATNAANTTPVLGTTSTSNVTNAGTVGSSVGNSTNSGNAVIPSPSPAQSPTPTPSPAVVENPTRVIQVAAFGNQPNSQKLIAVLKQNGLNAVEEMVPATAISNALYRVVIRDVAIAAIDKTLAVLGQLGYSEVLIRQK